MARRRSLRAFGPEPLSLLTIGRLAWSVQGVTESASGYRTSPSAGGALPIIAAGPAHLHVARAHHRGRVAAEDGAVEADGRGRGVARALLRGAVAHAEAHGAVALEAYPIDKPGRGQDTFLWNGVRSMFEREGFVEVARRRPERPVMRRAPGVNA